MTCIVGCERDGVVYIGGDSAAISDLDIVTRSDEKVFINGPLIIGFTNSFRMGQLLRYALDVPDHDPRMETMKWIVVDLVDAFRKTFSDKGYLTKENDVETGGTFLMGYQGKLYYVDSDFQIGHHIDGYAACGCGESYALGVLHHLNKNNPKMKPEDVLKHALDAASYHSGGVSKPYTILSL